MAAKNLCFQILIAIAAISITCTLTATVVEDLNNLQPPPDFNVTITNNCRHNPSLRYCNSTDNLVQIFKSTIVASHLCNISNNPNCIESFPKIDLRGHPKIAPLYLSFTFFWEFCPLTVLSIDLSENSLKGTFPSEVLYCSQIQSLDLSLNRLSGEVPVRSLSSSLRNLTRLNLSYNAFSECDVSERPFLERFDPWGFIHSGILPDHRRLRFTAVALFVGLPALVFSAVFLLGWLCFWRESCVGGGGRKFKSSALEEATDGFSKRNFAGRSGRRSFYRGVLRDGMVVMIEVWSDKMAREDRRRLVEEWEVLVRLRHRNVARMIGWCDSRRLTAVVTEWIEGKDVERWVRDCVPPWKQRVQAMLGIAAAVRYLHEEWPEIGCDLKSRNVLVSENGEPVVRKFKFDDHCSSAKKIHGFGVVVLEIVTNRWVGEDFGKNESGFMEWVKGNCPENTAELIDRRMKKTAEIVTAAAEMVEFGLICADLRRQPSWERFCHLVSKVSHAHRGHKHVHHRQQH